ncbi:uncharacterized protein [Mytilus edulis]|uniref:uncharacterized protein n=1 Tax=Mytilus edulis TaxID=6550 RepID=UPI0039F11534
MASGKHILCGPCCFDDVQKNAGRWCTKCEEGLCEDCEKVHRRIKSSRNHKVITIEDYRKIEHISISQVCEHHGENLEWFCKSHDEVLCVMCVPSKHKTCSDVIPISVYSANARQSTALSDLEETIGETLRNVKQCIKNRESATKEIEKRELAIKTMVLETRTKINGKLDNLQEKLLHELRSTSNTCSSKYMKILQTLKSKEEMLTKLSEQTIHMKQFFSDLQVFLGTRQVNRQILSEIESTKMEINASKDYKLKVAFHTLIEKLSSEMEEFGQISISESASKLDFRDLKIDQAQIGINVPTSRNIECTKLQLIGKFKMKRKIEMNIKGCVMLPNGHILFANYTKENQLIEYKDTGEHIRDINVSGKPYSITVIDVNRIAVTYGIGKYLEIMHTNSFHVEKKIAVQTDCWGISYENGSLYVISGHCTIKILDLSEIQKTFEIASKGVLNITTNKDKIFYTDNKTNIVHCCSLNGDDIWQFTSDSLQAPYDVAVDNYQNVYVVGYKSNCLTMIQNDGRDSITLLTDSNGLDKPRAVFFDNKKGKILICNEQGSAALYKVN